jgi:WXG100 family type VII secretion target
MATGTESKIDTKLFQTTADTVGTIAKEISNSFQDWTKLMQSMRGNWQGDTSDDIKNVVDACQKSADELLRSLGSYKKALYEIAGIYDKTEKNIQESSKSLKYEKGLR